MSVPGMLSPMVLTLLQDAAASDLPPERGSDKGGLMMPEQASSIAAEIDWVFMFITWLSVFFFVLITVLLVYFCWKYRQTPERRQATSQITHHTPLELTWTIIPLILVIAIFYVGMEKYISIRQPPGNTYDVYVTGQKWSWTFSHRNGATQGGQGGQVFVPVGRPVRFIMQSSDVLHSMFIPAFRVKQDVVPGRITELWFEVTEPGVYDLFCAEYCGTDHSKMLAHVVAYEQDVFDKKITDEANWLDDIEPERMPWAGARLYRSFCASCHTLDGSTSTGPSWQGVWERTVDGSNTVFNDGSTLADHYGEDADDYANAEAYIQESILNPKARIVSPYPGSMPTFQGQFTEKHIQAIIEFMKNLDDFDAGGNPKE